MQMRLLLDLGLCGLAAAPATATAAAPAAAAAQALPHRPAQPADGPRANAPADAGVSEFTPSQELGWSNPKIGKSREVGFTETFRRANRMGKWIRRERVELTHAQTLRGTP